jgi:hypothetical protein
MAKGSKSSVSSRKITFGKRKGGNAKKSYNKHSPRPKAYRGQGRYDYFLLFLFYNISLWMRKEDSYVF